LSIQWELLIFSLIVGVGAALYGITAAMALFDRNKEAERPVTLTALVLLVLGGATSVLHLARPNEVMMAIQGMGSLSSLSVELALLLLLIILSYSHLNITMRPNTSRAGKRVILVLVVLIALTLCYTLGNSYLIFGKPVWNTQVLAFAYLVDSLCVGGFLYLLLALVCNGDKGKRGKDRGREAGERPRSPKDSRITAWVVFALAVLQALLFAAYLCFLGGVTIHNVDGVMGVSISALAKAAYGEHAWLFWGGYVLCGMLLPVATALLLAFRDRLRIRRGAFLSIATSAAIIVLLGSLAFRCIMWLIGYDFISLFSLAAQNAP
jgi:anaerobic dimethyl sulfoxide reductase subunit C (anchor subunit)